MGLAWSLVWELGSCNIIVNVVVFGFVEIDMIAVLFEDLRARFAEQVLFGCFVLFEEVVGAVAFLVFFDVVFIIGAVLLVDGGLGMGY